MTAQVAILNREGVAMATDSAASYEGAGGLKIYNTINKLYTLSKLHPIGIMVYSSSSVMGMPVETIIKVFRTKELGPTECASIEEYSSKFLRFLEDNTDLFTPEAREIQCVQVVRSKIACVAKVADATMFDLAGRKGLTMERAIKIMREDVLTGLIEVHADQPLVPGLTASKKNDLLNLIEPSCAPILKNILGHSVIHFTTVEETILKSILGDFIFKDVDGAFKGEWFGGGETGFVIAGFGSEEYTPHLRSFEFVWSHLGVHCVRHRAKVDIGHDSNGPTAAVVPFAQHEMVDSFVEGRVPELDEVIARSIQDFFGAMAQGVRESKSKRSTKNARINRIELMRDELVSHIGDTIGDWCASKHRDPMLDTIELLPKEELAVIAGALVDLTITKRHASPDAETVGPPTDVAIISKGDGFIWIKRKHYFKPELNPHFLQNYFKEVT